MYTVLLWESVYTSFINEIEVGVSVKPGTPLEHQNVFNTDTKKYKINKNKWRKNA